MRSPQTIGDADPRPGISTFQRMFFVSLHSSGGSAVRETPVAYGPRHCGQDCFAAGSGPAPLAVAKGGAACSVAVNRPANARRVSGGVLDGLSMGDIVVFSG